MVFCKKFFLFAILGIIAHAGAQEFNDDTLTEVKSCAKPLLTISAFLTMNVDASTSEGNRIQLEIQWHHASFGNDTFQVIVPTQFDTTVFISTTSKRILQNSRTGLYRAMADHHLRERILQTTLRWDDLELLAKGEYLCPDSVDTKKHRLRTSRSAMWYTLTWNKDVFPDSLRTFGLHKQVRILTWQQAKLLPKTPIPSKHFLHESDLLWARLDIKMAMDSLEQGKAPIPWKFWELKSQ